MCFSAQASFTVAAILAPAGAYCVGVAKHVDRKWLPLAVYPVAFSIQQLSEGFVWLGLNSGDEVTVALASRIFLFFSHFFWLAWVPFSIAQLETEESRQKFLMALAVIAGAVGLSVYLPLLFMSDWLTVQSVEHSVEYSTVLVYDGIVSRTVMRTGYGLTIATSLLISSHPRVRIFGILIVGALLIAQQFFFHALISVWCFFAAVLSMYITMILAFEHRQQLTASQ